MDGKMYGGVNLFHFTGGPCAELVALGHARASGARELSTIVAVGNMGRSPVGPCGRDRQVLFDYHPKVRVILPTADGLRSVAIRDLMPLGAVWTVEDGTQDFDPKIFEDDCVRLGVSRLIRLADGFGLYDRYPRAAVGGKII